MPKDYPSVILPPIWREAIEMPPVYPSSAPLVCFQENKKNSRYTFIVFLSPIIFLTGHIDVFTAINDSLIFAFIDAQGLSLCNFTTDLS